MDLRTTLRWTLLILRFAVLAVAFILSAGTLKFSFGMYYVLVACLAGYASFRLLTHLYSRLTRELLTANSLLDETLKTFYIALAVMPVNLMIFSAFAFIGIGFLHAQQVPEEVKNFLVVRFVFGSIALIVLVILGAIVNRVGRRISDASAG